MILLTISIFVCLRPGRCPFVGGSSVIPPAITYHPSLSYYNIIQYNTIVVHILLLQYYLSLLIHHPLLLPYSVTLLLFFRKTNRVGSRQIWHLVIFAANRAPANSFGRRASSQGGEKLSDWALLGYARRPAPRGE